MRVKSWSRIYKIKLEFGSGEGHNKYNTNILSLSVVIKLATWLYTVFIYGVLGRVGDSDLITDMYTHFML